MLQFVANTNIVFSAIIKRGKIREIILLRGNIKLHIPEEMREELHRHIPKMQKYLNLTKAELQKLIDEYLNEVATLHNKKEYKHKIREAKKLLGNIDPTDAPFVALAMHLRVPLWTGDRRLLELAVETGFKYYRAVDTRGVEMLLEGRSWSQVEEYLRRKYGRGEWDINTKG